MGAEKWFRCSMYGPCTHGSFFLTVTGVHLIIQDLSIDRLLLSLLSLLDPIVHI